MAFADFDAHLIVFLDVDDVLCLNDPVGGMHVLQFWHDRHNMSAMWEQLFCSNARANLSAIDEEFVPMYVVSSSWANHFDRDRMSEIFQRTALGFVAERMHPDWTSQTPQMKATREQGTSEHRGHQIRRWIDQHPGHAAYLVIDDPASGIGIRETDLGTRTTVVLCPPTIGFQAEQYRQAREGLLKALRPDS